MRGEAKNITSGVEARQKLLKGAEAVYNAVSSTYGAVSGNVAIEKNVLGAIVTHDGVTVARDVYLTDKVEDIGAGKLVEASEKSNSVSGDGTSATVVLGYNILKEANKRVAAGVNPMKLRRGIDLASMYVKGELDNMAGKASNTDLVKVASISASDPEIGKLVADTVEKVGGIGITVEKYEGLGIIPDVVDGVYFEKGWTLPHFVTDRTSEEAVHAPVAVLIVEKKIKQNQDIVPIIEMAYANTEHKTLLIIGHIDGQALETCALTNNQGKLKVCVVKPPVYGDQELPFLEDIATLTGGKVVPPSLPGDKVDGSYLGKAGKVIVGKATTTIFEPQGAQEDVDARIASIKEQLKSDKYSVFQKERMEMRLAKLQGKIGIIRVGGATDTEADEAKFRVEDAIAATRAAKEDGIVPGGATTLARMEIELTPHSDPDIQAGIDVVQKALKEPFRKLLDNAGEDGGYRLMQVLKADYDMGFDVTNITDEPIKLMENGIIDPAKVLKSVVENACAFAGIVITIPLVITIDRQWQLEQLSLNKAG